MTLTREQVAQAIDLAINGEAFNVVFQVQFGDRPSSEVEAALEETMRDINRILGTTVRKTLHGKYELDSVSRQACSVTACVTALNVRLRPPTIFSTFAPSNWASSVDELVEKSRRVFRNFLVDKGFPATLQAQWQPGTGVTLLRHQVDPNSPDQNLREQLRELKRKDQNLKSRQLALFGLGVVGQLGALVAGYTSGLTFGLAGAAYFLIPLLGGVLLTGVRSGVLDEIRETSAHIDLRELLSEEEKRAHRMFHVNSLELKRYYDQALRQRALVFVLGSICISSGFAAVGASFYILSTMNAGLDEKIVVAVLGGITGILANFVAVIFLKMFAATVQSIVDFHGKLVLTHHVHFGNVLVAKIANEDLRNATLAKMALALAQVEAETEGGVASTSSA